MTEKEQIEHLTKEVNDLENMKATLESKIEELETENAELKSIADFQQSGNISRYFELKRQNEQLTTAKEIIKDLLGSENQYCEEEMFFTIRKRAEDFIKE